MQTDLPNLQQDTIHILSHISTLFGCYQKDGKNPYHDYQEQVDYQHQLVQDLELRVTIVAPMNAGKSTILNSIVGQELVPSHTAAMTTLPTELILNANLTEPVLTLDSQLCAESQNLIKKLNDRINQQGKEWADAQIKKLPHLEELLNHIQTKFQIKEKVVGSKAIVETLKKLNHLVRLHHLLIPDTKPPKITTVPRIETPFYNPFLQSTLFTSLQKQNKLVFVDTPGPNEAVGEKLGLVKIVEEQLKESSIVLIVLDFSSLYAEAEEKIIEEVKKVIQLRGKENLYVLVNKVDQRSGNPEDTMTPEQIQATVTTRFGIDNDRIFEISAINALAATNFLQEVQQYPDKPVEQLETATFLAQKVFGRRYQRELKQKTIQELKSEAEDLWNTDSGFPLFLETAIRTLMTESTHRCIRNALTIGQNSLVELSKYPRFGDSNTKRQDLTLYK